MIKNGLVEEVETLESLGLAKNLTASQAIGYKQCLDYLHSNRTALDWTEFLANFKQASRRYAKRQFTWFRREPLFRWLDMESVTFDHAAELIIQDYEKSF
jgi:tRNA dimethylallyltransferase